MGNRLTAVITGTDEHVQLYQGTRYVSSAWGILGYSYERSGFMVSVYMGGLPGTFYHVDTLLFCGSMDSMYRILSEEE